MRKKILGLMLVFLLAFVLIACKGNGTKAEEQEAFDEIIALVDIASVPLGDRGSITNSFAVPVLIAGEGEANDATVVWTSTNDNVAKYNQVGGQHLIVVTRPAAGEDNASVTLTASVTWIAPSGAEFNEELTFDIRITAMPVATVANISDIRNNEYAIGSDLKLTDVIVIHVASNGITVFDPETKTAIFVFGSATASVVSIGFKGEIVGEYGVNFDSPQLSNATFTKESEVALEDILAMATEKEVKDFWIDPYDRANDEDGLGEASEIAAKRSPELNTLVKFQANVRDEKSWNNGNTSNYTTVLYDTTDATKFTRSYYGGLKHDEIKLLDGKDNVTIYAVAYTVRNDRVKPSTIEGSLPVQEFFVIDYIADLTDEEAVASAKVSLTLPVEILEATTMTLPALGSNGTEIVWESDNEAVINATTGVVTLPEDGFAEVTLTATITKGDATDTKEFTVAVGIPPVVTIAELLEFNAGRKVTFIGTVSGFTPFTTFNNFDKVWVEDETGAITVYRASLPATLAIGDKFEFTGTTAVFNQLKQIDQGVEFTAIDKGNALIPATDVTGVDQLTADFQAKRINVSGEVVSVNASGQTMVIKVGETNLTVRANSNDATNAVNAKMLTAVAGQVVDLTNIHVDWFNGPQLLPTDAEQINFAQLTDAQKVDADKSASTFTTKFEAIGDLALPTVGTEFASVITYEFKNADDVNNELVDLTEGKVVALPATGTVQVTLVATFTLGEATETLDVVLTIGVSDGELFHETFTSIATELAAFGTGYGDLEFTGVNGVVWKLTHATDEDGGSNGIYAIDGTTVVLRRANEPSAIEATFANGIGEFSFEYRKAFTSTRLRTYSVDVTNNGATTTHVIPGFGSGDGADETIHTFELDLNLTGAVTIRIYATGSTGNQQASFDNFKWTE